MGGGEAPAQPLVLSAAEGSGRAGSMRVGKLVGRVNRQLSKCRNEREVQRRSPTASHKQTDAQPVSKRRLHGRQSLLPSASPALLPSVPFSGTEHHLGQYELATPCVLCYFLAHRSLLTEGAE